MPAPFRDRIDAGRRLAARLTRYSDRGDTIVLALPRGGVPVAFEVAQALRAPLDVFLVRKLGVPGHEELAMGAVAGGGVIILNDEVLSAMAVPRTEVERVIRREREELARREREYRGSRPGPELRHRIAILVDDGLATGSSMRAAVAALRTLRPARVVAAVPVAPPETCGELRAGVDELECIETPSPFHAVGAWYDDFSPTTDDEVRDLLQRGNVLWQRPKKSRVIDGSSFSII